ncbi:hypothetical protein A3D83_03540 [Candidatus Daviesbacteria bacterium RIFCSPHIGHO2_02_FULL_41_10]|uniref:DUF218 domain-containing protein n=1 Tax=Candidatus Daviesbacteria bacterium RIFCSPHIGHO2_02_FULL_41_10 TaxID=1797774 RepID=A0A1F5JUV2_9BACT|nr:MAG: hypothetical protein A3D83_03540 [Candidatus Daviesbacteria bacterium RIFCSPHIGHO2_02_FULL_41_10]
MSLIPEALELYQSTVRVLSSAPRSPVDVIFFHNRSYGDATGLFDIIYESIKTGTAEFVAVTNNEGERFGSDVPHEANPGKTEYIRQLLTLGIPEERIKIPKLEAYHTRQENTAFLNLAKEQRWTIGAILTQPHQALRTMLGAVQAMEETGYPIYLYVLTPRDTPWQEVVKGNQGIEEKPRWQHIEDECVRSLSTYQVTGELASLSTLLAYLNARDNKLLDLEVHSFTSKEGTSPLV